MKALHRSSQAAGPGRIHRIPSPALTAIEVRAEILEELCMVGNDSRRSIPNGFSISQIPCLPISSG